MSPSVESAQDALNAMPVMRFQCRENPAPKEYSPLLQRIPVLAEMLVSLVQMSRLRDDDQCSHDGDFAAWNAVRLRCADGTDVTIEVG